MAAVCTHIYSHHVVHRAHIMQLVVTVVKPGWVKALCNYLYVVTSGNHIEVLATNCVMVNTVYSSLLQVHHYNSYDHRIANYNDASLY